MHQGTASPPARRAAGRAVSAAVVVALFAGALGGQALARPEESPAATVLRLREASFVAIASWASSCPDDPWEVEEETTCVRTEVIAARESRTDWVVLVFETAMLFAPGEDPLPLTARFLSGYGTGEAERKLTAAHVSADLVGSACVRGEWDDDWGWTWDCEDTEASVAAAWAGAGDLERGLVNVTANAGTPGTPFLYQVRGTYRPATATGSIDGQAIPGTFDLGWLLDEAQHIMQVCRGGFWPGRDECRSAN